jgi:hypothetical protein
LSTERAYLLHYKSRKGELIMSLLTWACLAMGVLSL